jgi:hypothetical protein
MTIYPIYEGEEILKEFNRRPYYVGFQAKFWYVPQFESDSGHKSCYLHQLAIAPKSPIRFFCTPINEKLRALIEDNCVEGEPYIFTICNTYHQQLINLYVLALNFGCTSRQLYLPWRHDQLYPGYPIYAPDEYRYKEDGSPDVGSLMNLTSSFESTRQT